MEASRRVKQFFKKYASRLAIVVIVLVSVISPLSGSDHTKASLYDGAPLIPLTDEIVTVGPKKVEIKLTESLYQAEQKAKQEQLAARQSVILAYNVKYADPGLAVKREWAKKAASAYNIDWKILEAVWRVESGMRWKTYVTSYAGAMGPCQFMPGTWRGYAQDGNGDGIKDVSDARDCLFGAAKLLAVNGAASGNVVNALLRYNYSYAYVEKVLAIAKTL